LVNNGLAARRLWPVVTVVAVIIVVIVVIIAITSSPTLVTVIIIVIVAVFVVAIHRASPARSPVLFTILGLPVFGAWWGEIARDVLDAVFTASIDKVSHWGAPAAALNVGRLGNIFGLSSAMASRRSITVLGHGNTWVPGKAGSWVIWCSCYAGGVLQGRIRVRAK